MRCLCFWIISTIAILGTCQPLAAQEPDAEPSAQETEAVHNKLRALRDDVVDAYQKKDIDRVLKHMHKDAVITLQNAETLRGHQAIREFHNRMSGGDAPEVKDVDSKFEVDELSILYGDDTAVAYGQMNDVFELASGLTFDLASRWTATMVKEEGKWVVASFQISTNMFDNGVMDVLLKWNTLKFGGLGVVAGALLCLVALKLFGKLGKPKHA